MPERKWLSWYLGAALLLALAVPVHAAFDQLEYEKAAKTILCDCGCHPQSAYDCACGRAAEMRDEIKEMVNEGLTGDEVIARYVASHGDQIRIAPTAEGFNLVAWVGPFVGLVVAGLMIFVVLRRWQADRPQATEATPSGAAPAADDPYVLRLREELKELE